MGGKEAFVVADGDNHLREQLEELRTDHFEQLVNERTMELVQQEAQERDAVSTERAIIDLNYCAPE